MPHAPSSGQLRPRHYAAYLAVCFLLGSNWPAVRVLVRTVPPLRAAALSYCIAAAIMIVVALARRSPLPNRRDFHALLLMSVSLLAIPTSAVAFGEQYITASLTAVLWAAFPVFVALFTPLAGGARVPLRAFAGIVLACAAVAVLFWDGVPPATLGRLGAGVVLFAVLECAAGVLYAARRPISLMTGSGLACQFAIAAAITLAASLLFESGRAARWDTAALAVLLFLGIFGTALTIVLYYWLLRQIAPFQVGTIDLVVPVVAFSEGALLLAESVTLIMAGAAVVVLLATAYVLRVQYAPRAAV
jgi:drug/metabolite transporter (DMT)-like permease